MKLNLTSVSAAVAVALAAATAHAQLPGPPGYSTSAPNTSATTGNGPLILSLYDTTSHDSEAVILNYNWSNVTGGSYGNFEDPTPGTNGWTESGGVATLNFGSVPDFSAAFCGGASSCSDSNVTYWVTGFSGSGTGLSGSADVLFTQPTTSSLTTLKNAGVITADAVGAAKWLPQWVGYTGDAGVTIDTTGTGTNNTGTNTNWTQAIGNAFESIPTGADVGSALNFYDLHATSTSAIGTGVLTTFQSSLGLGYWMLTSSGDLTWNILVPQTIPLPAAGWLLLSGLAGLGAVGRRRRAVEALS
jgi:hypothetical protein